MARKTTRRTVIKSLAAGLCSPSLGAGVVAATGVDAPVAQPDQGHIAAVDSAIVMPPLDYGRSFICNTASYNSVRFWVESRTRIIDSHSNEVVDFLQCGSCKSEHTFAHRDLFHQDNYDFLPVLGDGHWLIFRRHAQATDRYRSVVPETLWGEPVLRLIEAHDAVELDSWEQVRDATAMGLPIVTQTELSHEEGGLRAVIECPCKTMNVGIDNRMYQVDTGPVVVPDLTRRFDQRADCLRLAFLAFNAPEFTDFVVEQPTPVTDINGVETCRVYHYSALFSLPATNRVFALGGQRAE